MGAETFDRYTGFARALLSLRCSGCDETDTLFVHEACCASGRGALQSAVFEGASPERRRAVCKAWARFSRAECSAEDMLDELLRLPLASGISEGAGEGVRTLVEEVVFNLVEDPERRLALQLAWLWRFPHISTRCCGEPMCFRCKVKGWHEGLTCVERQKSEAGREAQICPGCNVPVVKSEGCNHIVCVCGREWIWDDSGDPDARGHENIVLDEELDDDYEPTEQEIREYAEWLGMDLEADIDLLWIARDGLKAPLPQGWRPCQTADGEIFYFNFSTGESVWDHPCDTLCRQTFEEHKRRRIDAEGGEPATAAGTSQEESR